VIVAASAGTLFIQKSLQKRKVGETDEVWRTSGSLAY